MDSLSLKEKEINDIMRIVAIVLHTGNISLKKNDDESVSVENKKELEIVASLLEITPDNLAFGLTNQVNVTRGERIVKPLTVTQSADSREALSKALYGWLFTYIVDRINLAVCKAGEFKFIGVLDIFGFEDFKINSFEQFCINYANERLQQFFNQHIFKLEQEIYTSEGINWATIEFVDNQPCLDLVSKKPVGILHILDEECTFPKSSDASFLEKLHKNHATKDQKFYEKPKLAKTSFIITHYAGKVSYEVESFLEKNRDRLREDLHTLLESCGFAFVKTIISVTDKDKPDPKQSKNPKPTTAGNKFHESLTALVAVLTSCNPYFVRCVKPNPQQVAAAFDDDLVEDQLRYSGLLETVRIRKLGYPVRMPFDAFCQRYGVMNRAKRLPSSAPAEELRAAAERLLKSFQSVAATQWQIGKTRVFLKEATEVALEKQRVTFLTKYATKIQRLARVFLARRKRKALVRRIIIVQNRISSLQLQVPEKIRLTIIFFYYLLFILFLLFFLVVATVVRRHLHRRKYLRMKKAAIKIEAKVRMFLATKKFKKFKKAMWNIQNGDPPFPPVLSFSDLIRFFPQL